MRRSVKPQPIAQPICETPRFTTLSKVIPPRYRQHSLASHIRRPIQKIYNTVFNISLSRRQKPIYFEPNNLAIPTSALTVATIHDLSVIEYPQWHPTDRVQQWASQLKRSIATTDHWIVPSRFTRDRMVDVLSISPEQITVIALAGKELNYPNRQQTTRELATAGLTSNYFLHLGNIEPRKKLLVLLDAYAALPSDVQDDCRLIFAGPFAWGSGEFWKSLCSHPIAERVLVTGYINDSQIATLLTGATALVAPSSYEGFGLPILEAMACGTPVLCSTAEAFGETANGVAQMLPSDDPQQWAAAFCRLMKDHQWRQELGAAGLKRSRKYCWDSCAQSHIKLFQDLAVKQ